MPLYEFHCRACRKTEEALRRVGDFRATNCSWCGSKTERIVSTPTMVFWRPDRKFPNLRPEGDGAMSFQSRRDYELHLKENHIAEWSTDAPVATPHGAKVTKYGKSTGS